MRGGQIANDDDRKGGRGHRAAAKHRDIQGHRRGESSTVGVRSPPGCERVSSRRGGGGQGSSPAIRQRDASNQSAEAVAVRAADIRGNAIELSRDQAGCRLLQQAIDTLGREAVDLILAEHSDSQLRSLMTDPFGNYLFQKIVESCTAPQRGRILGAVASCIVESALNMHGTRSVQALVKQCVAPTERQRVVDILTNHVKDLSISSNGNHVMQSCLQYFSHVDTQFIFTTITRRILFIGTKRHGCCVVQRCIDYADKIQRAELYHSIIQHGLKLMQDPYGNYVVQYMIQHAEQDILAALMNLVIGRVATLSRQKFSSNVVEKCLHGSDAETQARLIDEITNPNTIATMLSDQYANYVVQKALDVASQQQVTRLVDAITPHFPSLKSSPTGRRILQKVFKRFPRLNPDGFSPNGLPG